MVDTTFLNMEVVVGTGTRASIGTRIVTSTISTTNIIFHETRGTKVYHLYLPWFTPLCAHTQTCPFLVKTDVPLWAQVTIVHCLNERRGGSY